MHLIDLRIQSHHLSPCYQVSPRIQQLCSVLSVPGKCVEHMRNDIVVQRYRWLIAIDAPVRIVNSVPIHSLQRCGKGGVVTRRVEVVSAHFRSS